MKVGFISQWYEPEPGAAAHPTAVVRALARAGHEVTVLTGLPSYPTGRVFDEYRGRGRMTERWDGVEVHRVPYRTSHDSSALRRANSYLSFAFAAARRSRVLRHVEVCLVYSSPATVALPAIVLRQHRKIPFVLYVQDLWPDSVVASGFISSSRLSRWVQRVLRRACSESYKRAAAVAAIAPGMRDAIVSRGVAVEKTEVVYNWVDESIFKPTLGDDEFERSLGSSARFVVMYAGGLGEVQGLEVAVRALARLTDLSDLQLVFVGEGVAERKLRQLAAQLGVCDRLVFAGGFPLARMPAVMSCSDVQLVSLKDLPVFRSTIPSKVQATMATGLPLLVSAPGDARRVVDEAGAGVAVSAGDDRGLAEAIRELYELSPDRLKKYGDQGRSYYLRRLGSAVGERRLTELLTRATATKQSSAL